MNANSKKQQQSVRPGFLILAVIALGGVLYWNYFMQPEQSPNRLNSQANTISPVVKDVDTGSQPEPQDLKTNSEQSSERDLFLPPSSVITARRNKDQSTNTNQPIWNEPKLIRPDEGYITSVKTEEHSEKPVWKGVLGTTSTQVIIVKYLNKSYLLKIGDIIPGSEYRVMEISSDAVILTSPKGRLKLEKKERAKNG